jgi:site-specific DNA recombinase
MASVPNGSAQKPIRCAIYTRKSTDEGLNQDFNSLDAQREAGEAYIRSQAGEGWVVLPEFYDDGGYTGANMERPALKRLLANCQARRVDCVVVYKVDRLSRSIRDFARIMETFEKCGATFVSVTQQFNTTTSLGRLTLNILLSFAQFEREIISERTRDKQMAARRRGKWTGGHVPLGYDLDAEGGRLVVNSDEASSVRQIFEWYLEGRTVFEIVAKCGDLGWCSKQWTTREGRTQGGHPMRKCHLYQILGNPLYAGRIRADGEMVGANHEGIVDGATFDLVHQKLKANTRNPGKPHTRKVHSPLKGLLYCATCGSVMTPSYTSRESRRYRYYVCQRSMRKQGECCPARSVPAPLVEKAVVDSLRQFAVSPEVVQAAAKVAREKIAEELGGLREELKAVNVRVRNGRSQLARAKSLSPERQAELREQLAVAEARAGELRVAIARGERMKWDEEAVRVRLGDFEGVWGAMSSDQQTTLLRKLIERVGYDSRGDKVRVTYNSKGIKEFCQKGVRA